MEPLPLVSEQEQAAITIQKHVRGWLYRSHNESIASKSKHKKYIINEILSNERAYVKGLNTLTNVVYKPLLDSEGKKVVDSQQVVKIFSNVEELHCVHANLLRDLSRAPSKLGAAFLKTVPTFRLYRTYLQNHKSAVGLVSYLQEKNAQFRGFVQERLKKHPDTPQDLLALLALPTTQLPRYKLLLQDLLAHTLSQNEDYSNISNAILALDEVIAMVETPASVQAEEDSPVSTPQSTPQKPKQPSTGSRQSHRASTPSSTPRTPSSAQATPRSASRTTTRPASRSTQATVRTTPVKASPRPTPVSTPRKTIVTPAPQPTPPPSTPVPDFDSSLPSYLRPTQASCAYSVQGRAKKDEVAYTNSNAPIWMPNGDAHVEKIYQTVYNAIPFTKHQSYTLDRISGPNKWLPGQTTPRTFDSVSPSRPQSQASTRSSTSSPRHSPMSTPNSTLRVTPTQPFTDSPPESPSHRQALPKSPLAEPKKHTPNSKLTPHSKLTPTKVTPTKTTPTKPSTRQSLSVAIPANGKPTPTKR